MLVVETIAKIRRAHFIQGKSIKQICRELRVGGQTSMPIDTFCGNVKYGCAIALPETCNSARFQQFLCDVSTASTCGRKNRTLSKLVTCVHVCA